MDEKLLRDMEILTELMEQGGWKDLRVSSDRINISLSQSAGEARPAQPRARETAAAAQDAGNQPETLEQMPAPSGAIDPDWTAVKAPNLGAFYRSPKPGAPPFVEVGQKVQAGTELCLIEVMKLFTSVRAEQAGTIRHIAAADAELVEGGQPLIYIEQE